MPVKLIGREYKNQFYGAASSVDWLLGNVGDWQRARFTFEGRIEFLASDSQPVTVDLKNQTITLVNGRTWASYGFDLGDTVIFSFVEVVETTTGSSSTNWNFSLTVQNLFGSVLEHDRSDLLPSLDEYAQIPLNLGTRQIKEVEFKSAKEPEGIKFRYSHISNDDFDSTNVVSFLDSTVTEFSYAGLNTLPIGVAAPLNPDGLQSGMGIKSAEITKISVVDFVYTYQVDVIFILPTIFEDPDNLELPLTAPSVLFNAGSLTDNVDIVLFPEWNNPNTQISNDPTQTARLGNTGWYNENFNGLDNNFTILSVRYFDDDDNTLTALDFGSPVNVEVIIDGITNLTPASEFGFGFAYIPQNEDEYFNLETPYQDNLFINTGREYTDGVDDSFNLDQINTGETYPGNGLNGAAMDAEPVDASVFAGAGVDEVVFKARFTPNAAFTNLFGAKDPDDRNYVLWVSVSGNPGAQINFSDRVSLFVDYGALTENIQDAGPYPGMTNKFIEHPQAFNVLGVDKYFGFLNDDILSRVLWQVPQDGSKITAITFGYEVENVETGLTQNLQSIAVDLNSFEFGGDTIQDINFDDIRGFKLEPGNNKNWVRVLNNPPGDTATVAGFVAYFAAKIRWEDWLARDGVADEYFNTALPNNGFNNDWLDYLRSGVLGSKKFYFFVRMTIDDATAGEEITYKNQFEIDFVDYDENLNIVTTHEYYRDSDNTLINIGIDPDTGKPLGTILNDEPTRIEITFENLTEDFDFNFMYGVMSLEIDGGPGQLEQRQLSSVWGSEADNPLYPVAGETRLKFELLAPRIIKISARVNPDLLAEAARYRVTGRIGCWPESPGTPVPPGIYEPFYAAAYE